jgi:hypothetical protein
VLSGSLGEGVATATATVQSVNMKTREVALRDESGKTVRVTAGPEVRNLAQVKKGDVLRVTYRESLAYTVNRPGAATAGVGKTTEVRRAAPGDKPAAHVSESVSIRSTIADIDKTNARVTLRDPDGHSSVVTVRDPSKLDRVQVGDVVDITYTEAVALAVERP